MQRDRLSSPPASNRTVFGAGAAAAGAVANPPAASAGWRAFDSPALLLATGALLTVVSQLRFGVGFLAWVAPVPFLRTLRIARGWRARLLLAGTVIAAWICATAKITTAPLPLVFAFPVGAGVGAAAALAYLAWDLVGRRRSGAPSVLAFAASGVAFEWLQLHGTPLATWGAAAYTQVENLPLLQLASIAGMAAVSFVVYWVAAWIEAALSAVREGGAPPWRHGLVLAAVLAAAEIWGTWRLNAPLPQDAVKVASVGTTATFTGFPGPARPERDRIVDRLLADTVRAADAGARLVVWNEAAAIVEAGAEEQAVVARALELARGRDVEVVMAYIVPTSAAPPSYENKLVWASPGGIRHTYLKHHPAPGEPSVVGTGPLEAVRVPFGTAGGALCYDYDYPAMALQHARLGVGIVALPSSDWRGIDPVHTQMAALRAVEGGFSIVRSTRFGLSAAIDGRGRMRAWHSSFDGGDRVLLAEVPARRSFTAYAVAGDVLPWACLAAMGVLAAVALFTRSGGAAPRRAAAPPRG